MSEPHVFISYSWDSEEHKVWVRKLAEKLQLNGAKVFLDQWDTYPGIDLPKYMETSVRDADFVLLICTPLFAKKANDTYGGVGYEKIIVTGEIFEGSASPKKFVPLIRVGQPKESLPSYLKSKLYIDFRKDSDFETSSEQALRHLHGAPLHSPPPIGPTPSFDTIPIPTAGKSSTVYCGQCGNIPGSYSSCVGGLAHNFLSSAGTVYCSRCGKAPGSYSSCIGGSTHDFKAFK